MHLCTGSGRAPASFLSCEIRQLAGLLQARGRTELPEGLAER